MVWILSVPTACVRFRSCCSGSAATPCGHIYELIVVQKAQYGTCRMKFSFRLRCQNVHEMIIFKCFDTTPPKHLRDEAFCFWMETTPVLKDVHLCGLMKNHSSVITFKQEQVIIKTTNTAVNVTWSIVHIDQFSPNRSPTNWDFHSCGQTENPVLTNSDLNGLESGLTQTTFVWLKTSETWRIQLN